MPTAILLLHGVRVGACYATAQSSLSCFTHTHTHRERDMIDTHTHTHTMLYTHKHAPRPCPVPRCRSPLHRSTAILPEIFTLTHQSVFALSPWCASHSLRPCVRHIHFVCLCASYSFRPLVCVSFTSSLCAFHSLRPRCPQRMAGTDETPAAERSRQSMARLARVKVRSHTGLTLGTDSVCFGFLCANGKFNSWQRVTVEMKERGSGSLSSENLVRCGCESSSTRASHSQCVRAAPLVRVTVSV